MVGQWYIKYTTIAGKKGHKFVSGQNKMEARYNFKFLYPDYIITKIMNTFYEDYEEDMKSTAVTGKF